MTITPQLILTIICVAVEVCTCVLFSQGLRRQLMMLQQNSYRPDRYRRWMQQSAESTGWLQLSSLGLCLFCMARFTPPILALGLLGVYSLTVSIVLARRKYKKPLVMTARARRILATALTLGALGVCAVGFIPAQTYNRVLLNIAIALTACFWASPWLLLAALWILRPLESRITRGYINDARARLATMPGLKIVGVTGSYGKTTTKHILQRILLRRYETLMTPGSFNTPMGVVRTVREHLKPYHQVFIVEMGAKAPGDIAEICEIVHPQIGIITAVGPQHLESFKTLEKVQQTKFELADALPADGVAVLNNDFPKIADRPVDNVGAVRYAVNDPSADYYAEDIRYTPTGTYFTIVRRSDGHRLALHSPLLGECNVSNVLGAAVVASRMGVSDSDISYAVENLEQIEHRLSIRRIPGGLNIIDDAFNSNPVGSAMALDVLAAMTPGRRILVTPGMIELGTEQEELNRRFGRKAADCADTVIIVGQYNRQAIADGLREGGAPEDKIVEARDFAHAQEILATLARPGDTVLYENDLPDTFK